MLGGVSAVEDPGRYVFVTGGVVSGLGKGITAAALGALLVARGLCVALCKCDPYLNVDPGTMSPLQHGEVFVTADGTESDLDLGHYERFIDCPLTAAASITAGAIYEEVIRRERRGDFAGATVQVIPHVTDAIKARIRAAGRGAEVTIVEIGGTVGDIESLPFLESIRQLQRDVGRDRCAFVHVTLVPYLSVAGELKTKATQHSVNQLRGIGIEPDVLVLRAGQPIGDMVRAKIALFGGLAPDAVISAPDAPDIYRVPLELAAADLDGVICRHLGVSGGVDLAPWQEVARRLDAAQGTVRVALIGKYVQLPDAYLSVSEALRHAALAQGTTVQIDWIDPDDPDRDRRLAAADGILVPGGFGTRGIEGLIATAGFARRTDTPYLGICLGLQVAVIEHARQALSGAHSTEFAPDTTYPVVCLRPDQAPGADRGGTLRLGEGVIDVVAGSRLAELHSGALTLHERHRHRYEVNPALWSQVPVLQASAWSGERIEAVEDPSHPFFMASQYHPEFASRPTRPHPLFVGFLAACRQRALQ